MVHRLRILMIIGRYRPRVGGAEIQAERLSQALSRRDVTVDILTGREHGLARQERNQGVVIHRLWIPEIGAPVLNALALGAGLYRAVLARRNRFDVLHVHQALYPAYAGILAARRIGKPSIVKITGGDDLCDLTLLSRQAGPLGRRAARFLADHTDAFIALNEAISADLKDTWDVPARRIVHIPNGVDVFRPGESTSQAGLRKELGLPVGPSLLICVGRLTDQKNHVLLFHAMKRLAGKGRNIHLLVLGDGPLRTRLEHEIRIHGLEDRIRMPGAVTRVRDHLGAADLFVLPSRMEGLSNALLEAMAAGMPCIASDIPGNRAVIQHGDNGLLFDVKRPESLADAVLTVIDDPAYARTLGRKAQSTIAGRFTMEHVSAQYIDLYRRLMEK